MFPRDRQYQKLVPLVLVSGVNEEAREDLRRGAVYRHLHLQLLVDFQQQRLALHVEQESVVA